MVWVLGLFVATVLMSHQKLKLEEKECIRCGRPFRNRKKWIIRGIWNQILYCSEKCRRTKG